MKNFVFNCNLYSHFSLNIPESSITWINIFMPWPAPSIAWHWERSLRAEPDILAVGMTSTYIFTILKQKLALLLYF